MIILADGREVCVPCIQGTRATIKYYYIDQAGNVHIDFNNHPSIVIPRKPIEITKHINTQTINHITINIKTLMEVIITTTTITKDNMTLMDNIHIMVLITL